MMYKDNMKLDEVMNSNIVEFDRTESISNFVLKVNDIPNLRPHSSVTNCHFLHLNHEGRNGSCFNAVENDEGTGFELYMNKVVVAPMNSFVVTNPNRWKLIKELIKAIFK